MSVAENFRDALEGRRSEMSTFMWVSRELNNLVPYAQRVKLGPGEHKEAVLRSEVMQDIITRVSLFFCFLLGFPLF